MFRISFEFNPALQNPYMATIYYTKKGSTSEVYAGCSVSAVSYGEAGNRARAKIDDIIQKMLKAIPVDVVVNL